MWVFVRTRRVPIAVERPDGTLKPVGWGLITYDGETEDRRPVKWKSMEDLPVGRWTWLDPLELEVDE